MTNEADRPAADLGLCASRLEVGDWPGVLALLPRLRSDGSEPWTRLGMITWDLAGCQRCRARGDPEGAAEHLQRATAWLPARIRGREPGPCGHRVVLVQAPSQPGPPEWTWRTYRVAWREQWELIEVRVRFASDDRSAKRDQLIDACIDFLTWRDLCEYARQPGPATRGLDLTRGPANLLRLANASRKFGDPRAGDLTDRLWTSIGGFDGLHVAALRRLAGTQPRPWAREGVLAADVPARRGRRVASRMARRCFP